MGDSYTMNSYYKHLLNENSPCQGIENVSIIVNKKWKRHKKHNVFDHAKQPSIAFRLSRFKKQGLVISLSSMPELNKCTRSALSRNRSRSGMDQQKKIKHSPFQSKFIANVVSEHRFDSCFLNPFNFPSHTKWKIYRCQLGSAEDSCCCSCNSDAMFEVMKSLYDCYKSKNCDNCDCVLCGHLPQEERKLGEIRKSMASVARENILDGKSQAEKEEALKEMAEKGIPLPAGKTASDKGLIAKISKNLGLPPPPKTAADKEKMQKAALKGLLEPLEGKTPAQKEKLLKSQAALGLPLPEGRTPSEKALIAKIAARTPSLKASGLLSPLKGKTPEQKEKILKGLAIRGVPLPEAKTPSDKKVIDKVRDELGLPAEPTTKSIRGKHEKAAKIGLLQPLEGKTPAEKEKILKDLHDMGIPLPKGRTPSEKALVAKVAASSRAPSIKTAGLLTPLKGKTPEQKEKILKGLAKRGLLLPESQTPSEKKIIDKVRADLGLPAEPKSKSIRDKHEKAAKAGLLQPLQGKTPAEKENILKGLHDMGIPLPEGRTPSEKALVAKVAASPRAPGAILIPLKGKTPQEKEDIIKGLAAAGMPLPEGETPSEKKIIVKVRADLGLPAEPKSKSMRDKHEKAAKAGLLQPLESKTPAEKEKILKGLHDMGIPLPEGRTPSEKAIVAKVAASPRAPKAKVIPLKGKTPQEKEDILKGLAAAGMPLPEGETPSEKQIIGKVRADLGLPVEPKSKSIRDKHEKAAKAGLLQPLEGKTPAEKEKILKGLHDMAIPLPEGRTPSEKALVAKVVASPRAPKAKLIPLKGKTPQEKEDILKGLAAAGMPLPEGETPSEKKIIGRVRADLGLPAEPKSKSIRDKHEKAAKAGLLQPLEGKTPAEKEKILKGLHDMGIPLPEGRTPSEKGLVAKVAESPRVPSIKTAGLLTPLKGKTAEQKENILKGLAEKGMPLPEGKTPSEKKIIGKVRADLGLPAEPKSKSIRDKHEIAAKAGLLQPLEGKTPAEKEKILKGLHDIGIPLPEGRTPSEKALVDKVAASPRALKAKLIPLKGKTPQEKEDILKGLAVAGIPLPEGDTPSEKKIIGKVRADLGLPADPKSKSIRDKHEKAAKAGLLQPLEGKTPAEKEKLLKGLHDMGIPLPEGRTPSEKALVAKVATSPRAPSIKTAGLLTPLKGKTAEQKENILKGLAEKGMPLPEGKTPSEKKVIGKVRADLGLPAEPKSKSIRDKHEIAAKAGLLQPLEGKTPAEKEKILKDLHDIGIPLPEGRTPSEKALVDKVAASPRAPKAKLIQLKGKTPQEKEDILKGLAVAGIPLPEGDTPSVKKIISKVRADLGLPAEPKSKSIRDKHETAAKAGLLQPLEGKTPAEKEKILKGLHDIGIPLPEGRTPSEKALVDKVAASPRAPKAKLIPLKGGTPQEKEDILKGLAAAGMPLPEGETPSEKKIIGKVRADLGLPAEPKSKSIRDKHEKAAKAGFLQPLEGKTPAEKERILKGLHDIGIPLPEGRTPSEKALVAKVAASPRAPSTKTAGFLTPLKGKTPEQKENILKGLAKKGMPLPEGQTPSEKKVIDKVRADLGLPAEPKSKSIRDKHEDAAKAGLLKPLEGKTPVEKEKILKGLHDMGIPLPNGRTPSEKALIARVAASPRAPSIKTAGLLTPLKGKTPEQKENILKGLAKKGMPLPEGQTPSEKKVIDKVRADLGLPAEPKSKSIRNKHKEAAKAGLLQPLDGKTPAEKEKILKGLHDLGIPLPEGRTPTEKALVAKVAASPRAPSIKTTGLLTPLKGKTPEQKKKILKGLAAAGIPLPEGETPSEKKIISKVRADFGLPAEPKSKSMRDKHEKAAKAGLLKPLEGKTPAEKENILKGLHDMGIPLPEGRTPSEKALVAKVAASPRALSIKIAGLLTPLKGKTPEQKENILKGLAEKGMPLPEGQTPSEKKVIGKVRADLGLPAEPKSKSIRDKHEIAAKAGLLQPLEGKTPAEKEKILKGLHDIGIPLPEGRTPSEKALIDKVAASPRAPKAKLIPLKRKTSQEKEDILKGLAAAGMPLPEGETPSEKKIIGKVRADLGLPAEPKSKSIRDKHEKAAKAGLLQPLEGKTPAEKERILKGLHDIGIPLPEGRTPSEKALVAKVAASPRAPSIETAGFLTPLKGKTPEQKENILKGLAEKGMPLPEGQTPSEKKVIDKVRANLGLPAEPKSKSIRDKHEIAAKAGLLQPLEGKTPAEKEKILKGLHDIGIPLPEGRTPSEKALVDKVAASPRAPKAKLIPLKGKTPQEKEDILKGLAVAGIPLPEGDTPSEKKIIGKVRADLGLPAEPKSKSIRDKHEKAAKAGLLQPLEGKTPAEKERILKGLHDIGIPLPEGRTPSEKALVAKVAASPRAPSIKTAGLLTPLKGKTPEQKENILKGLAKKGMPLPEGKTPSEKKVIDKVRADLGLPAEPKTKSIRDKHDAAAKAGLLQPLEGKTPAEKEKIVKGLHDLGIPLPEGRTPSEKALIAKVAATPRTSSMKTAGLLTPLKGKTPEQKEKILKGLAKRGLPLPESQTQSEKKLINKVRADLGLPVEPPTKSIRDKHEAAAKVGLLQPLEGKTPAEKEKIVKGLHDLGIPLPEGRTPSEKALIAKVAASSRVPSIKIAGLLTPVKGKTPEQKENILKGLAKKGMPLPEGQTPSEKNIIDKVRADLGLPAEPKSKSIRDKHEKAAKAGLLQPLEGKTPAEQEKILKGLHDMGIPLPEGRTPSEKALIAKVAASPRAPSIKTAGLLTPLKGKTPEQKEKVLKGLAKRGLPLPESQTQSEKKLINKVRADLGLPVEPPTKSIRDKHEEAAKAGLLQPLEGKTPAEKEKILKGLHDMGIPLPKGRTPSEKSLIAKVAASPRAPSIKTAGLLTPLKGKTPEQKENILKGLAKKGMPLPEGKTPSEKKVIDKVRADLGLPVEPPTKSIRDKHEKAAKAGLLQPLEGKTPAERERILKGLHDMGIPLPKGRTPSEKSLIAKVAASPRAPSIKTAGLLTPLKEKTPEQKEKILKGLAKRGLPLPEGETPSEKKIIGKVRADLGLPVEPPTKSIRDKHEKAAKAGLLQPLEGKTPAEQERILKGLHDMGIPLPEGRTPSEKALIANVAASSRTPSIKTAGLLTPLQGKTPDQKEKILKGLAKRGLPLPEGQTPSDKKVINQVRTDLGLPVEPPTKSIRDKHEKAAKAGLLQPLEGKTPAEQERILKGLHDMGIPLPEGRTPSEKALIANVAASSRTPSIKTTGLLTPLQGKTPDQKEKILKGLAKRGLPLPEGETPSEKKIIGKVRADLGLPAEPPTKSIRDKHEKAAKAGLLQPLEGKTPGEQERILKGLHDMGIPLPEGRTPSEKALIAKVAASSRAPSIKTAGLLTPLQGKTPERKEKILKGLAKKGLPLPEGETPSEKKIIGKVRADLGLPSEPPTKSIRDKHEEAAKAGLLQPLEGKTPAEKKKILKGLHDLGIPLPEGRTPSEKSLIAKVAASSRAPSIKTAGLLTPLHGKTPERKEKILKGLAKKGLPLPEGETPSEKKIIGKVRADFGLPAEPPTKSIRDKHKEAAKAGLLQPLEGKTPAEKEKILKGLHDLGIPLPEGRTPSEKSLIAKVAASSRAPSIKTAGLLTPLQGKTPLQKEKKLKGLAKRGLPLPEGQTPSDKKLINKVRADLGLPVEPPTKSIRDKHEEAAKAGLLQPLEGKTPAEKEKILKGLHDLGIPLPEGRTPSEKSLIAKVAASSRAPSIKTAGLLTPLQGKTPLQKEKKLKGLAKRGLPLPEGQTPSDKKLINKVRADLGLPVEPPTKSIRDKHEKAAKAGLLQPLEGKAPAEKEKILKGLHDMGIPLPVGRTPSEKALIADISARPPKLSKSLPTITTEKMKKAKAAGLFTPFPGKTPQQKEDILKGLAEVGLPLPEGKTPSEKVLIAKVKKDLGIVDRTPSEKLRRAKATGLLTPLEGKTPAQKEKLLRGRAAAGLPLPIGKSPSERALVQKIKDDTGFVTPSPSDRLRTAKAAGIISPLKGKTPSMKEKILRDMKAVGVPIPEGETPSEKELISKLISSEKLPADKTAGLLTPLDGKTPAQKEKILEGLFKAGLPLPEGKTKSEKSMIAKIKARIPVAKTPSEKSIIGKAKAAGLFTPISGKTPEQKEKILRGLAEAGLPLPEGTTPFEKDLVKKIRAEAGLPLVPTPSEKKGKIRKKTKKVGVSESKKAAGISAGEIEEIVKTTTCDRSCGCDKKKIKFKHSYVKIRVTSPDISSFCDCDNECLPGVKAGAFIDNEGIKVTVGSAIGIPSYSTECINQVILNESLTNYYHNHMDSKNLEYETDNLVLGLRSPHSENIDVPSSTHCHGRTNKSDRVVKSLKGFQSLNDIYKRPSSKTKPASSFDTILIIKNGNNMSLSTSTSNSMETISLVSFMDSSITCSSAHYSGCQSTNDFLSISSLDGPSTSDDMVGNLTTIVERKIKTNIGAIISQKYTILGMSQLELEKNQMRKVKENRDTEDPIVLLNHLPSKLDVSKIMHKIKSKKRFAGASSIFIVVPTSDDDAGSTSPPGSSWHSIQLSEWNSTTNTHTHMDSDSELRTSSFIKDDKKVCGKGEKFYMEEILSNETEPMFQNESLEVLRRVGITQNTFRQSHTPNEIAQILEKAVQGVGSDLTADRPSCTFLKEPFISSCIQNSSEDHSEMDIISRLFLAPLSPKDKNVSWFGINRGASSLPLCSTRSSTGRCCRQQIRTPNPESKSLCHCSEDKLKVTNKKSVKVQKPSIESICCSASATNTGKSKFISWISGKKVSSGCCTESPPDPITKEAYCQCSHNEQPPEPEKITCQCPPPSEKIKRECCCCCKRNKPGEIHCECTQNATASKPTSCECSVPGELVNKRSAKVQKPSIQSLFKKCKAGKSVSWLNCLKGKSSSYCGKNKSSCCNQCCKSTSPKSITPKTSSISCQCYSVTSKDSDCEMPCGCPIVTISMSPCNMKVIKKKTPNKQKPRWKPTKKLGINLSPKSSQQACCNQGSSVINIPLLDCPDRRGKNKRTGINLSVKPLSTPSQVSCCVQCSSFINFPLLDCLKIASKKLSSSGIRKSVSICNISLLDKPSQSLTRSLCLPVDDGVKSTKKQSLIKMKQTKSELNKPGRTTRIHKKTGHDGSCGFGKQPPASGASSLSYHLSISSMPSYKSRHDRCNQQNQSLGVGFSRSHLPSKRTVSAVSLVPFQPPESTWPCESPPDDDDDVKVIKKHSAKVQKPSVFESLCNQDRTATDSGWFCKHMTTAVSSGVVFDTLPVFHLSSSHTKIKHCSPKNPTPGSCCSDCLKVTRNPSVKVQKPSIASMDFEGILGKADVPSKLVRESKLIRSSATSPLCLNNNSSCKMPSDDSCYCLPSSQCRTSRCAPSNEKYTNNKSARIQKSSCCKCTNLTTRADVPCKLFRESKLIRSSATSPICLNNNSSCKMPSDDSCYCLPSSQCRTSRCAPSNEKYRNDNSARVQKSSCCKSTNLTTRADVPCKWVLESKLTRSSATSPICFHNNSSCKMPSDDSCCCLPSSQCRTSHCAPSNKKYTNNKSARVQKSSCCKSTNLTTRASSPKFVNTGSSPVSFENEYPCNSQTPDQNKGKYTRDYYPCKTNNKPKVQEIECQCGGAEPEIGKQVPKKEAQKRKEKKTPKWKSHSTKTRGTVTNLKGTEIQDLQELAVSTTKSSPCLIPRSENIKDCKDNTGGSCCDCKKDKRRKPVSRNRIESVKYQVNLQPDDLGASLLIVDPKSAEHLVSHEIPNYIFGKDSCKCQLDDPVCLKVLQSADANNPEIILQSILSKHVDCNNLPETGKKAEEKDTCECKKLQQIYLRAPIRLLPPMQVRLQSDLSPESYFYEGIDRFIDSGVKKDLIVSRAKKCRICSWEKIDRLVSEAIKDQMDSCVQKAWLHSEPMKDLTDSESTKDLLDSRAEEDLIDSQAQKKWIDLRPQNNWIDSESIKDLTNSGATQDWIDLKSKKGFIDIRAQKNLIDSKSNNNLIESETKKDLKNSEPKKDLKDTGAETDLIDSGPKKDLVDLEAQKALKSKLINSNVGFEIRKMKQRPVQQNTQLDFGDAIRCFARLNPELFRKLMQEELERQLEVDDKMNKSKVGKKQSKMEKKVRQKVQKKAEKEAKKNNNKGNEDKKFKFLRNFFVDKKNTQIVEDKKATQKNKEDLISSYPRGLKFHKVVKGLDIGVAGVDC